MLHEHQVFRLTTRVPSSEFRSITLIADPDSTLADGIAADLEERDHQILRVGPGEEVGESTATVMIIEREASLDALRGTLDRSPTPTLVLAATRRLAGELLPLLGPHQDLATAADTIDILSWRLERLLRASSESTARDTQKDALTGLLTRHVFEQRLKAAIEAERSGQVAALLYFDLDQFKEVNDCLGHIAGDSMLRVLGAYLQRRLPPEASPSRLGGDEFACILTGHDSASIVREGAMLLQGISELQVQALCANPSLPRLTASAGLAFFRQGVSYTTLYTEADMASYQAKSNGRNRLEVYGQLAEAARKSSSDLSVTHFENVTRVATERLVEMITLKSRRLIDAARQEANVCALTGLHNRRYFDPQLTRDIERAKAERRPLTLALIDIDDFHVVNATHGWPAGDRALQAFAAVAQANIRSTDWVARYAGDEFVIVLPNTALDSARFVVERVRHAFAAAAILGMDGQCVSATLSAGVIQLPEDVVTAVDFVEKASKAALKAKKSGRNRVSLDS